MNKRQIKKFCKKGGYYHFDKTIKRMSHKRLMHPYITRTILFNHMITWYEIGTCITCDHCTDVMVDWDGAPYAYYSTTIGCGGCGKFACKRYKLDKDLKFFKFVPVHSDSPESDLKRYIDEQIKRLATDTTEEEKEERPFVVREELFDGESILEYLDQLYAGDASNGESDIVKAMKRKSIELSFDKIDKPIIQIYGPNDRMSILTTNRSNILSCIRTRVVSLK